MVSMRIIKEKSDHYTIQAKMLFWWFYSILDEEGKPVRYWSLHEAEQVIGAILRKSGPYESEVKEAPPHVVEVFKSY
jgi:hypothetical protein